MDRRWAGPGVDMTDATDRSDETEVHFRTLMPGMVNVKMPLVCTRIKATTLDFMPKVYTVDAI